MKTDQAELDKLMQWIDGSILGGIFGPSISGNWWHTYPGRDASKDALHGMCCELEEQGKIVRAREEPGHVVWQPASQAPTPPPPAE